MVIIQVLLLLATYLLGSIPFGFIIGKIKGIDVRQVGSKNIGATNTGRALGKKYAVLCFFLDFMKGFVPTFLFRFGIIPNEYMILSPALYGFLAIVGHVFPIFLRFKGGKAVATGAGFASGYCPILLPLIIIVFFLVTYFTKMVSIGSLVGSLLVLISFIVLALLKVDPIFNLNTDYYIIIFAFLSVSIIFIKHRQNIKRIIEGTESKVKW